MRYEFTLMALGCNEPTIFPSYKRWAKAALHISDYLNNNYDKKIYYILELNGGKTILDSVAMIKKLVLNSRCEKVAIFEFETIDEAVEYMKLLNRTPCTLTA